MTTKTPTDLAAFRGYIVRETGITDLNGLGIAGDRAHQLAGGYHLGFSDLQAIGRFHPPADAHVGSTTEDYSARQLRDRQGLTDDASAIDVDHAWPNGGTQAWLRWNNLLVRDLRAGVPQLAAVRAVNTTLDTTPRRFDVLYGFVAESTSDTGHTHIEFWRDTANRGRAWALTHLLDLMTEAITGVAMAHTIDEVFDLIAGIVDGQPTPAGVPSAVALWIPQMQAGARDAAAARAAIEAMQQNPPVMPTAAAIAGEIIKQLGITPR